VNRQSYDQFYCILHVSIDRIWLRSHPKSGENAGIEEGRRWNMEESRTSRNQTRAPRARRVACRVRLNLFFILLKFLAFFLLLAFVLTP